MERLSAWVPAAIHLNESVRTVAINFEGGRIHNNEINGPYEVKVNVNNETWGFGHAFDHTTGDHLVLFAGDGERIEIKHQAHSRQAFAGGAIRAARWVMDAPIGVHDMEEVLGL